GEFTRGFMGVTKPQFEPHFRLTPKALGVVGPMLPAGNTPRFPGLDLPELPKDAQTAEPPPVAARPTSAPEDQAVEPLQSACATEAPPTLVAEEEVIGEVVRRAVPPPPVVVVLTNAQEVEEVVQSSSAKPAPPASVAGDEEHGRAERVKRLSGLALGDPLMQEASAGCLAAALTVHAEAQYGVYREDFHVDVSEGEAEEDQYSDDLHSDQGGHEVSGHAG
ncbi:MAG: hypothetical protein ACKPKO_18205, partial [Candidatus Fonsibacter sp.]